MRARLTDRKVKSLTAPDGAYLEVWDETFDVPKASFGIRLSPTTGRKSWVVIYNRNKRLTIGRYPGMSLSSARDKAHKIAANVLANGADPVGERKARAAAPTFGELAEMYLQRHASRKRSGAEDERQIRKDLLPRWGEKKADEVTRADVMDLLDEMDDRGAPIMANRTRALVSKVYNVGMDRGLVESNPALRIKRPKETSRQRVLTAAEIRTIWSKLDTLSPPMAGHFKLRFLTAQRGVEVLSMRWKDLDDDWWTIPARVAKNGQAHRVPLSPQSRAVIESLRKIAGDSEWVFPNGQGGHIEWVQHAVKHLREVTKVEDWRAHDIRRSASTFMTSMGIARLVVSKILNHAETGVTSVYDRASYDTEKRQALSAWGGRLAEIVSGKKAAAKVVATIGGA